MKYYFFLPMLVLTLTADAQGTSFNIDSSKFIMQVMVTLDSIYQEDQIPRYKFLDAVQQKEKSLTIDSLRKIMLQKDQENLRKVKAIIDHYGWLSPKKVGMNASQALFLVIQHADLATQRRYLPMIRAAEKNGEILSSNLAILEDRINMREGKKQIYGSQSFTDTQTGQLYIYPIAEPDHLEERRKSMGLIPMQDYAKLLHTNWNLKAFKKMLPEIEKIAAQLKL
jgi:hypothetical protein